MGVFARGVVLGVIIAAPLGPLGLMCIRRTAERGLGVGLATGLGAAIADMAFSAIGVFGVALVLNFLSGHRTELQAFGGLVMLAIALHSFTRDPVDPGTGPALRRGGLAAATLQGFLLTAGNPVTVLGMTALVVSFGGGTGGGSLDSDGQRWTLLAGIFAGSMLWWSILCGGTRALHAKVTPRGIHRLNIGTGVFLLILAGWALGGAVWVWLR